MHPKKSHVKRCDMFVMRICDADDKEACLQGEPDLFFTTDHDGEYATVIMRLGSIDLDRLAELIQEAWEAAPGSTKLARTV